MEIGKIGKILTEVNSLPTKEKNLVLSILATENTKEIKRRKRIGRKLRKAHKKKNKEISQTMQLYKQKWEYKPKTKSIREAKDKVIKHLKENGSRTSEELHAELFPNNKLQTVRDWLTRIRKTTPHILARRIGKAYEYYYSEY